MRSLADSLADSGAPIPHIGIFWEEGMPVPDPPGSPATQPWDEEHSAKEMAALAKSIAAAEESPERRVSRVVICSRPRIRRGRASARRGAHRSRRRSSRSPSGSGDDPDESDPGDEHSLLVAGDTVGASR